VISRERERVGRQALKWWGPGSPRRPWGAARGVAMPGTLLGDRWVPLGWPRCLSAPFYA